MTIERTYYQVKDVMQIVGCGKSYAYDLIRKLRSDFAKEYPDVIVMQARIPIWYFEKKLMNKKNETKIEN